MMKVLSLIHIFAGFKPVTANAAQAAMPATASVEEAVSYTHLTSGKVSVKPDGTLDRASMATITNPDDLNALEAALKLKDATGCEVVVITMGPPPAEGMRCV